MIVGAIGLGHGPQPWMTHKRPQLPPGEVLAPKGSIGQETGQLGEGDEFS
jgi:hypothetical protein